MGRCRSEVNTAVAARHFLRGGYAIASGDASNSLSYSWIPISPVDFIISATDPNKPYAFSPFLCSSNLRYRYTICRSLFYTRRV